MLPIGYARCQLTKEPSNGNGQEVDEGEEEINAPGAGIGEYRREHDDGEVADPVGAGRCGSGSSTGTQRVDLWWVDPRQRKDGKGEKHDEEVDTDSSTLGILRGRVDQTCHGDDEGETLTNEADEEELAATDLLNHEEGWDGGKGVDGGEDTSQDKRESVVQANVGLEE